MALDYPKESIDLYLHVGVAYHEEDVAHFVEDSPFHSVQLVPIDSQEKEADARNAGLQYCQVADSMNLRFILMSKDSSKLVMLDFIISC